MKKMRAALLVFLALLALSAPAWANGKSKDKQPCLTKNDTHYGHYAYKSNKHKLRVLKQFRLLKKTYNKAGEDAQKMFLEFLGSTSPDTDAEIKKIRDEYEQRISQLNATIESNQEQITQLNAAHNADQQALEELAALRQTALDDLAACNAQNEIAYGEGYAAGTETCANTIPGDPGDDPPSGDPGTGTTTEPQLVNAWDMGYFYPFAVDVVDGTGNFFALDADNSAVVEFDSDGFQTNRWYLSNSEWPADLAVDSTGAVYVLHSQGADPLQKYNPSGQPMMDFDPISGLDSPRGLFIDSQDMIYVTDMGGADGGGRVQVFNSSGIWQNSFSDVPALQGQIFMDVAVDEQNQIAYVVTSSTVAKFDSLSGAFLGSWQGAFTGAYSIAIGTQGQVYVSDINTNLVYQYDTDGNLIYTIGVNDDLQAPAHIVVDNAGILYVADYFNLEIKIYQ